MSFKIGAHAQELVRKLSSQNPPEDTAPSGEVISGAAAGPDVPDASADAAAEPAPQATDAAPQPRKKMNFKSVDAYSLRLDGGFGWRNFQNGQKLDHDGGMFRLAAGLRIPVGRRLALSPRLAYEYQGLKKPLGFGVESRATAHMVGLEIDLGIALHPKWFSLHPVLGFGAAIYRAPGSTDGLVGAEFNKNAQLFPIRSAGARIELGLQLCTWGDAICLGAKFAGDMGINPTLDVIDAPEGGNPPMGLSPMGAGVSVGVDVLRIVSNVRNRKRPQGKEAEPVPAESAPVDQPTPEEADPSPPAPEESEPKPSPPALPTVTVAEFEAKLEDTKMESNHVQGNLKLAQRGLGKIKDPKTTKPDKKINADSAVSFYRRSAEKTHSVEVTLAGLYDAYGKMSDPQEGAKAFGILQEIEALYKEMAAQTVELHGIADQSVKAYNKRRGSEAEVAFADPKPEYPALRQE